MDADWILVEDANGLRTELLDDRTRMLFGGMGGDHVTTLHRRTEVHDTYVPRRTTMAYDAHGLLGTTHAMAATALLIRLYDYV